MNRLNELADAITQALNYIQPNEAADHEIEARRRYIRKSLMETRELLRSAAAEPVGTEWDAQSYNRNTHNAEIAAARLAVANAKAERDAALSLAYQYPPSDPYNPDGVTWRQMYEMLDEKSLGEKHGHACAMATLTEERAALQRAIDEAVDKWERLSDGIFTAERMASVLRPHASKPAPVAENATPVRQWSSTPPTDRSGRWWNAWNNTDGSHGMWLVPLSIDWRDALDQKGTTYDLWLPHVEGDTKDTLPPLPNSSATLTGSPNHSETPKGSPTTRELVARLVRCVMHSNPSGQGVIDMEECEVRIIGLPKDPEEEPYLRRGCWQLASDARRGGAK